MQNSEENGERSFEVWLFARDSLVESALEQGRFWVSISLASRILNFLKPKLYFLERKFLPSVIGYAGWIFRLFFQNFEVQYRKTAVALHAESCHSIIDLISLSLFLDISNIALRENLLLKNRFSCILLSE